MDELLTRGDRVIFRQPVDMSNKKMLCNDNVYIVSKVGALNGCSNKNIFLRCKTCAAYCVCVLILIIKYLRFFILLAGL